MSCMPPPTAMPSPPPKSRSGASVTSAFSSYIAHLEGEHERREEIKNGLRDLEQTARELAAEVQKIHNPGALNKMGSLVDEIDFIFSTKVRPQMATFAKLVPDGEYFRYHGMFWGTMQRLVFAAAVRRYLSDESLLGREEAARALNVQTDPKRGFHLELEDYLSGLIMLSNELARFSVNCVTAGAYMMPLRISVFIGDLLTGFRLLNLKNDSLRKKFDSLKYDLKKTEEVVYDIAIRGLVKPEDYDKEDEEKRRQKADAAAKQENVGAGASFKKANEQRVSFKKTRPQKSKETDEDSSKDGSPKQKPKFVKKPKN